MPANFITTARKPMVMFLGDMEFRGTFSPVALTQQQSARWGRIAMLEGKDAMQFAGMNCHEAEFELLLDISICQPAHVIYQIQTWMEAGDALQLAAADTTDFGTYVIETLDITHSTYNRKGVLEQASVKLKLIENPDAVPKYAVYEEMTSSISGGGSNEAPLPDYLPVAKQSVKGRKLPDSNTVGLMCQDMKKSRDYVATAKSMYKSFKSGAASARRAVRDMRKCYREAQRSWETLKTRYTTATKIWQRAGNLPTSTEECIRYAENLAAIDDTMDSVVIERNTKALYRSMDNLSRDSAGIIGMQASKEKSKL